MNSLMNYALYRCKDIKHVEKDNNCTDSDSSLLFQLEVHLNSNHTSFTVAAYSNHYYTLVERDFNG